MSRRARRGPVFWSHTGWCNSWWCCSVLCGVFVLFSYLQTWDWPFHPYEFAMATFTDARSNAALFSRTTSSTVLEVGSPQCEHHYVRRLCSRPEVLMETPCPCPSQHVEAAHLSWSTAASTLTASSGQGGPPPIISLRHFPPAGLLPTGSPCWHSEATLQTQRNFPLCELIGSMVPPAPLFPPEPGP